MSGPSPELLALRAGLVAAGDVALAAFRKATPRLKDDGTEVSDADVAAEGVIVDALAALDPSATIRSEEGARRTGDPERTWYVDPLDGTSAYLDGLAHWGPTVCLVEHGRLVRGGLYLPRLRELWLAERGGGAWLISDAGAARLAPEDPGTIGRNHSLYVPSRFHRVGPLAWTGKVRALGSSAFHLAQVAAGFGCRVGGTGGCVGAVVARWSLWDVGAGLLMIEEAGRRVATLAGGPLDPVAAPGSPFVVGTPAAIAAVVSGLTGASRGPQR